MLNAECLDLPKSLSSRPSEASGGIYALPKPFRPNRCVDPSTHSIPLRSIPFAQDDRLLGGRGLVPLKGDYSTLVPPQSLSSRLSEAHGGIYALPKPFRPNRCVDPSTHSIPLRSISFAQDDRWRYGTGPPSHNRHREGEARFRSRCGAAAYGFLMHSWQSVPPMQDMRYKIPDIRYPSMKAYLISYI